MNFLDFVEDQDDRYLMTAEFYESYDLTFTEDSIFSISQTGLIEAYPYFASNDSLYAQSDFFGDVFMGLGSPAYLRSVEGFARYSSTFSGGDMTIESSESLIEQKFHTFETLPEHWEISSLQDIKAGDTLIVNNRYVHFK